MTRCTPSSVTRFARAASSSTRGGRPASRIRARDRSTSSPASTRRSTAINGAISYLRSSRKRVQPNLRETSYFGFSFGGILTANLANRYLALGLPKPRAIFLDDPEDGGLAGGGEPALDDSLGGIPPSTKFECHSGAEGALVQNKGGVDTASCNAVFPKIPQIPNKNKDLVLTHTDSHGQPDPVLGARRVRRRRSGLWPRQRLRLELLLEGLGRASKLRLLGYRLPLRARQHTAASLARPLERRSPCHPAEDPERCADRPVAGCRRRRHRSRAA